MNTLCHLRQYQPMLLNFPRAAVWTSDRTVLFMIVNFVYLWVFNKNKRLYLWLVWRIWNIYHGTTWSVNVSTLSWAWEIWYISLHRATPMICITFWLQLMFLVLILRQSDAVSYQRSELQNEISGLEGHRLKTITELEYRNEILVSKKLCEFSSKWYSYMYPNVMWMVIILYMCRHYVNVICSLMLREWLLYCPCFVNVIQLYVAQCYVSGYYILHVSALWYSYI